MLLKCLEANHQIFTLFTEKELQDSNNWDGIQSLALIMFFAGDKHTDSAIGV